MIAGDINTNVVVGDGVALVGTLSNIGTGGKAGFEPLFGAALDAPVEGSARDALFSDDCAALTNTT